MVKAELELEVNKLRTEEAALRDSLHKMQALNEGLGQDKIELNKIIMQVSNEASKVFCQGEGVVVLKTEDKSLPLGIGWSPLTLILKIILILNILHANMPV